MKVLRLLTLDKFSEQTNTEKSNLMGFFAENVEKNAISWPFLAFLLVKVQTNYEFYHHITFVFSLH